MEMFRTYPPLYINYTVNIAASDPVYTLQQLSTFARPPLVSDVIPSRMSVGVREGLYDPTQYRVTLTMVMPCDIITSSHDYRH